MREQKGPGTLFFLLSLIDVMEIVQQKREEGIEKREKSRKIPIIHRPFAAM